MAKSSTLMVGACGEHYVAAYLSGHQLIVAMPRAGIPGADLYVSSLKDGPAVRIQVKTGTASRKKTKVDGEIYLWHAAASAANRVDGNLWYAFVWLNKWPQHLASPHIFFVPSRIAAAQVQVCLDSGEWPFFWMTTSEALKYQEGLGLEQLKKQIEVGDVRPAGEKSE